MLFRSTYVQDGGTITNTQNPVVGHPEVGKILSGRAWQQDDTFTFTLTAKTDDHTDGTTDGPSTNDAVTGEYVILPDPATATVSATAAAAAGEGGEGEGAGETSYTSSGNAVFDNITFKKAGTYTFEIRENSGTPIDGLTYSQKVVYAKFEVTEGADGVLSVTGPTYAAAVDDAGTAATGTLTYAETVQNYTNMYISLKVIKLAKGTTTQLNGAEFQLTRKLPGESTYTKFENVAFAEIQDNGQLKHKGTFTVNGEATISGLCPGDYKLEEKAAPAGYIIETGEILFTINPDGTVTVTNRTENNGTITYSDNDNMVTFKHKAGDNPAEVAVDNTPGAQLPATGGSGTAGLYGAGAALILLAILGLVLLNRKGRRSTGI